MKLKKVLQKKVKTRIKIENVPRKNLYQIGVLVAIRNEIYLLGRTKGPKAFLCSVV